MSSRTYSTVPSLQPKLAEQIETLHGAFAKTFPQSVLGCYLIGSCARGEATYRSDIDLLAVINKPTPQFSDVQEIRDHFEQSLAKLGFDSLAREPLPVQISIVGTTVFATQDPAMLQNLLEGIILFDPNGSLAHRAKPSRP